MKTFLVSLAVGLCGCATPPRSIYPMYMINYDLVARTKTCAVKENKESGWKQGPCDIIEPQSELMYYRSDEMKER